MRLLMTQCRYDTVQARTHASAGREMNFAVAQIKAGLVRVYSLNLSLSLRHNHLR